MREAEEFHTRATLVLEHLGCEIIQSAA